MNKELDRNPRRALGKGLSSLMTPRGAAAPSLEEEHLPLSSTLTAEHSPWPEHFEGFQNIPLDQLRPNEEQPRETFDAEKLQELAQSIQANGLIQPITVRKDQDGHYRIIAGERR